MASVLIMDDESVTTRTLPVQLVASSTKAASGGLSGRVGLLSKPSKVAEVVEETKGLVDTKEVPIPTKSRGQAMQTNLCADGLTTGSFSALESSVRVPVKDTEEARAWFKKVESGDFTVRLKDRLLEGSEVEVVIGLGSTTVPLLCRVKQVFRSGANRYGAVMVWLERPGVELDRRTTLGPQTAETRLGLLSQPSGLQQDAQSVRDPSGLESPETWSEKHFGDVYETSSRSESGAAIGCASGPAASKDIPWWKGLLSR